MEIRTFEGDGGERFTLRVRDTPEGRAYDLVLGGVMLLSSAALETELAFGALAPAGARRVIVGGLGFGATLRGVLAVAHPEAEVLVVEKLRALPALLRGPLADATTIASGAALDDPRVRLVEADVFDALVAVREADAVLLDVDNGPGWASFRSNARLYAPAGLAQAHAALRPGGLFAVWSGYRADAFLPKLRAAGFTPDVRELRERGVVRARAYCGVRGAAART